MLPLDRFETSLKSRGLSLDTQGPTEDFHTFVGSETVFRRRLSTVPQVWSVHLIVSSKAWPTPESKSVLFQTGRRSFGFEKDYPWLPTKKKLVCSTLSTPLIQALDNVEVTRKRNAKKVKDDEIICLDLSQVEDTHIKDSHVEDLSKEDLSNIHNVLPVESKRLWSTFCKAVDIAI